MGDEKHDDVGRLCACDRVKKLRKCDQESTNGSYHNDSDKPERDLLRPKRDVNIESQVMYSYIDSAGDGILQTNAIEQDVNYADNNFPNAISTEEITKTVEILTLECTRKLNPLLSTAELVQF